ncbi:hypothetical protein BP5796_02719 [Coleophoma crateriformis]|uniref:Uncharacterized protein n=1 Tax=Coleophoma crateriformis TaxID=565419 RepID=A0A3D8SZ37_9HELO|nr:hypothetical protein BP5796_02719 [Coleophoma crateriformis]
MASTQDTEIKKSETIPLIVEKKEWKKRPWSDAEFLRLLRREREGCHFGRRFNHFYGTPVNLKVDLLLSEHGPITEFKYTDYGVEHLQNLCNKATVIYGTECNTRGISLYKYILDIWSHGDIHTTDVEFGRNFATFMQASHSDGERPTTQGVLKLHTKLLDAAGTAKANGFSKNDPLEKDYPDITDMSFKANHQIEYFNIKPLCRTLIIKIESPDSQLNSPFEQQLEKRDPTVLETYLGIPKDRTARIEKAVKASEPMWTAGFWPTGPSTDWWELANTLE